eukprot:764355-Hanusia_phi.AAC.3
MFEYLHQMSASHPERVEGVHLKTPPSNSGFFRYRKLRKKMRQVKEDRSTSAPQPPAPISDRSDQLPLSPKRQRRVVEPPMKYKFEDEHVEQIEMRKRRRSEQGKGERAGRKGPYGRGQKVWVRNSSELWPLNAAGELVKKLTADVLSSGRIPPQVRRRQVPGPAPAPATATPPLAAGGARERGSAGGGGGRGREGGKSSKE